MLEVIKLSGIVSSGVGQGRKLVALSWVKQQIRRKLGFTPFPGTLNIKLSEGNSLKEIIKKISFIRICAKTGYCNGKLIRASIGFFECAIVVPEIADYPKTVLEIVAPVNLREKLQICDGDKVTVTIKL